MVDPNKIVQRLKHVVSNLLLGFVVYLVVESSSRGWGVREAVPVTWFMRPATAARLGSIFLLNYLTSLGFCSLPLSAGLGVLLICFLDQYGQSLADLLGEHCDIEVVFE